MIVGRIECSRGNTPQPLFVTISNTITTPPYQTVRLLHEQPTNQSWCLVTTSSMQECFVICNYPTMDRVMVATNDPVEGYDQAKHIRIEKLPTPIVQGQPLPIDPNNEFYLFRKEPATNDGYYLCSQSKVFPDTVMQGGYQISDASKNVPNVNDFVTLHNRQGSMREWFWFENKPTPMSKR